MQSSTAQVIDPVTSVAEPDYGVRMVCALRQIAQTLDMNSRYLLKQLNTTMPQLMCLQELNEQGSMTISVLTKKLFLSAGAVVGIVDRLEEKKLVTRTRDLSDRRLVFLEITEAGRDLIIGSPHLLQNRLRNTLQKLTKNEKIMIVNSLEMTLNLLREEAAQLQPE